MATTLRRAFSKQICRRFQGEGLLLIALILFSFRPLLAQTFASNGQVHNHQYHASGKPEKLVPLQNVLSELAEKYHIKFAINDKLVQGRYVDKNLIMSGDAVTVLNNLLKPMHLGYIKIDNYFVIQEAASSHRQLQGFPGDDLLIPAPRDTTITGKVLSTNDRQLLRGVSVQVKGTTIGAITDSKGIFILRNVPADADSLLVSYIGYFSRTLAIQGRKSFDILLQPNVSQLNQVVVVGYGTQKKSDLTSAISSVTGDELQGTAAVSPAEALQGKVSGVQIQQTNGAPGGEQYYDTHTRRQFHHLIQRSLICSRRISPAGRRLKFIEP